MSNIKLSICIPTYNFGLFIGETLNSIIDQAHRDIEVIVLDGASTDNTQEIVTDFHNRHPWIAYHRLDAKGGIDKDIARTVEFARGEYCWLMSSDDALKPGAIRRMLDEIELGHDIYLCNRIECDRELKPVKDRLWLSQEVHDHVFTVSSKEELINYFGKSLSLGALFSFLSSIIVSRDAWNKAGYDERFTGSSYAHVFRLFSILLKGGSLKYIREPLILSRGGNDSFADRGQLHRLLIDLRGYVLLASHLFSDRTVKNAFLKVMQYEHTWYDFMSLKKADFDIASRKELEAILATYGYPKVKLHIVRIIGSSRLIYAAVRFLWKKYNGVRSFFRPNRTIVSSRGGSL